MTPPRVDEIKYMLRACTTVDQVNAVARSVGNEVQELSEHPTHGIHAIHIRNLAALMRLTIENPV